MNSVTEALKVINSSISNSFTAWEKEDKFHKCEVVIALWEQVQCVCKRVLSESSFAPHCQEVSTAITRLRLLMTPLITDYEAISLISNELLSLKSSLRMAFKDQYEQGSLRRKGPKIGLKISFFCDFALVDHNGAVVSHLLLVIKEKLPFITTRSLLRRTGCTKLASETVSVERALLADVAAWHIYQKIDPEYGNELILFLPTDLEPNKRGREKLKSLDFIDDGSLHEISLIEALQGPEKTLGRGDIQAFFNLFSNEPVLNKIFYFVGHGNADTIAALNTDNYKLLKPFLERQLCSVFLLSSCCSGGLSSLLNIADSTDAQFFMTIVRSIGDFPTYSNQEAEEEIGKFFHTLEDFVASPGAETLFAFRKLVEGVESGREKRTSNWMKVYFPHSLGVPGGFRSVCEQSSGYSLTYASVRRAQLSFNTAIIVKNFKLLLIHPMVTNVPVVFKEDNPILISMTPGDSHHFIKSIELAEKITESSVAYIRENIEYYRSEMLKKATKGFFIETIVDHECVIKHLAIQITPEATRSVWQQEGNHYYMVDVGPPQRISPLTHALIASDIAKKTSSSNKAVRSISGGQESEELFYSTLCESTRMLSHDECVKLPFSNKLSIDEIGHFIIYHLENGEREIALLLAREIPSCLEIKNFYGAPLISIAIQQQAPDCVEFLLSKNVNLDSSDGKGLFPLHHAIIECRKYDELPLLGNLFNIEERYTILEYILSYPGLDIDKGAKDGWPPIFYALPNQVLVEKLIAAGATIHCYDANNLYSLLSAFTYKNDVNAVELLLAYNADPNSGSPSALTQAIYKNNAYLVSLLMNCGANPLEEDDEGKIPLIEAIVHSSVEIVKMLLKGQWQKISDGSEIFPLLAALFSGNHQKIELMMQCGAVFNNLIQWSGEAKKMLNSLLQRYILLKDGIALRQLLELNNHEPELEYLLFKALLEADDLEVLTALIDSKHVLVHNFSPQGRTLFNLICWQAVIDFTAYQNLITVCLKRGVIPGFEDCLLAIESQNVSFVKMLLKKIDFYKLKNPDYLFLKIIALCNLELVKLAVLRGAKLVKKSNSRQTLPLQQAAKNLNSAAGEELFVWMVEQGADLNLYGRRRRTPFCEVILSGNLKMVQYCITKGAVIIFDPAIKVSPLVAAANIKKSPMEDIFKYLYKITLAENPGCSPFKEANLFRCLVSNAPFQLIEWALNEGAKELLTCQEKSLCYLQYALERKDDPEGILFKKLVEAGADINQPTSSGQSLLYLVFKKGKIELVEFCFANGAISLRPSQHKKAIEAAVSSGSVSLVKYLLKRDYILTAKNIEERHLLYSGYKEGGGKMLQCLLKLCCKELKMADHEKESLWSLIIRNDDLISARLLFEKGATPFLATGRNIVQQYALNGLKLDMLNLIIEFGGVINPGEVNASQLEDIIFYDNRAILELLLIHQLDPNFKISNLYHSASLFEVALNGIPSAKKKIIKLLMEYKVDPCQKIQSRLPLYTAVDAGDVELVAILIEAGAYVDIDTQDAESCKSPRQLAFKRKNVAIIEIFEGVGRKQLSLFKS